MRCGRISWRRVLACRWLLSESLFHGVLLDRLQHAHACLELVQQLIECQAKHLFLVHGNPVAAPLKSLHFGSVLILVSSNHEYRFGGDFVFPKAGEIIDADLTTGQLVKPVDDLAVAVLEPPSPFSGCLLPLLFEDAFRPGILKLDEAICATVPVSHRQVTGEVAEKVELLGEAVGPPDPRVEYPEEGCELPLQLKEWQDIVLLGETALLREDPSTPRLEDGIARSRKQSGRSASWGNARGPVAV